VKDGQMQADVDRLFNTAFVYLVAVNSRRLRRIQHQEQREETEIFLQLTSARLIGCLQTSK